jgi:hypothetical protein
MKKYEVIYMDDLHILEKLVRDELDKGWKLQGGISISWNRVDNCMDFAQALVMEMEQ